MVSLGNETRSTASTRSPCRASSIAVAAPATRAPTTITSYRPAPIAASFGPAPVRYRTDLPYGSVQLWRGTRDTGAGAGPRPPPPRRVHPRGRGGGGGRGRGGGGRRPAPPPPGRHQGQLLLALRE